MIRTTALFGLLLTATTLAAACSSEEASRRPRTGSKRVTTDPATGEELPDFNDPRTAAKEGLPDPLEGLARGQQQNDNLCARAGVLNDVNPRFNAVTNAICVEKKRITSIKELQAALGIDFKKIDAAGTNGSNGNPGFALLGHSSSLVARSVSAINPRAFVFTGLPGRPVRAPGYVAIGFARGEPFVEIAADSPRTGKLTMYLFKFDIACEENHTCQNADLLTPAIEQNWKGFTLYDDEDLKNTLMDCRHCHQPDASGPMMLRMQELEVPWTHWFRNDNPGGLTLLQDYFRAHSENEDYGGIPGALIQKSDGRALEDLVKGQGFANQPNVFDSPRIELEVARSQSGQPEVNSPKGTSPTWKALFDRASSGQFIPPPYHDVKVTDPNKLQYATDAYKNFMANGGGTLPDIRRVFLDEALEALTFVPTAGLPGRDVLMQTCAQCHNSNLDLSITRAKFDMNKLGTMSRAEKDVAIARLLLPSSDRLKMPPASFRSLPDDARDAAIAELKK